MNHGRAGDDGSYPVPARRPPAPTVSSEPIRIDPRTLGNAPKAVADSTGRCNNRGERLRWCHPAKGLSRAAVQFGGDGVEGCLGEGREVDALREVLAQEA